MLSIVQYRFIGRTFLEDFKNRIINRILKENLDYKESNEISDIMGEPIYSYGWALEYDSNKNYIGGRYVCGPICSNESDLVKAYKLSHELGHHLINNKMNPLILLAYYEGNKFLEFFIEILAWRKAKSICLEENINTKTLSFFRVMTLGVLSYLIGLTRYILNIVLNILKIFSLIFFIVSIISYKESLKISFTDIFEISFICFCGYLLINSFRKLISKS